MDSQASVTVEGERIMLHGSAIDSGLTYDQAVKLAADLLKATRKLPEFANRRLG